MSDDSFLKFNLDTTDQDIFSRAHSFSQYVHKLKSQKHFPYRRISLDGSKPVTKVIDSDTGKIREMIYFASNDYLNLTQHPLVIKAGREALEKYGAGAGSVPLLGGTFDLHVRLEKRIAEFKRCQNAIVYSSGFGTNCGTILALLDSKDLAILDIFAHASIFDGCAKTNKKIFKHNDMKHLEAILKNLSFSYRSKLILVDGVYSMDGDIAPLDKIVQLAREYKAYVLVDEAHATGVIGKEGRGTPEHFNLEGKIDIISGTFSKGLGGVGGYIAGNEELIELLRYYSRPYMFSTAIPPQVAGSLIAALDVIEKEPEHRERLWDNIRYFRKGLLELGFNIGNAETAIFPIIIGDSLKVKEVCRKLDEMNLYVNQVLYPAVPLKLSRIRMSLMSQHTKEHLDLALIALDKLNKEYNITKDYAEI